MLFSVIAALFFRLFRVIFAFISRHFDVFGRFSPGAVMPGTEIPAAWMDIHIGRFHPIFSLENGTVSE
jgi:hypothetical protein